MCLEFRYPDAIDTGRTFVPTTPDRKPFAGCGARSPLPSEWLAQTALSSASGSLIPPLHPSSQYRPDVVRLLCDSPVRQASSLPSASFRFHLAADTLAVRPIVPLVGPVADLHSQVIWPPPCVPEQYHAWRTIKNGVPKHPV